MSEKTTNANPGGWEHMVGSLYIPFDIISMFSVVSLCVILSVVDDNHSGHKVQ